MGNNPTKLTENPDILAILTNKEVIALDQDALGLQGTEVWQSADGNLPSGPSRSTRRARAASSS